MVQSPRGFALQSVSLCVICHDRPDELASTVHSVRTEPWHEILVLDMASDPPLAEIRGATVFRSETNIGPAAGRNRLAQRATGELLVFLDDDVLLRTPAVKTVQNLFGAHQRLAIVAFKVHRGAAGILSREYPFRGRVVNQDRARPCAYFVSAGYACRKAAVDAPGGYDERLFIYCEELELSFGVLSRGWKLWYEPSIEVEHRPSTRGRSAVIPANTIRNRFMIVRRYLPGIVQPLHLGVWIALTLLQAARSNAVGTWLSSLMAGLRVPVSRRRLSWRLLMRIHRLGGRVLY